MAGEKGPLKRRPTKSTAPEEAVAGVECRHLKGCSTKRKAEAFAGEECPMEERAAKRIDCSEGEKNAKGEEAPAKKMTRLPQEEVDRILGVRKPREPVYSPFLDLKRKNPSLLPSPEEEKDEYLVVLYGAARERYEAREEFAQFQAWVRREYKSKGFVEVDYDYFGQHAEAQARSDQARDEEFRKIDFNSDSEDDEVLNHIKRRSRGQL